MPDIFFLSFRESNAEDNWQKLVRRFPQSRRLHGIPGVLRAHQHIASLAQTDFFFIVDGDNSINDDFSFDLSFRPEKNTLYVWRALNPVNDLVYGFGGIKLYNKSLFAGASNVGPDIATTITPRYKPVPTVASTTAFNASPLESWRGAYRECAKLTMQLFKNPEDRATRDRLEVWLQKGRERTFGSWCLLGAKQGHEFAKISIELKKNIHEINDFQWLEEQFLKNNPLTAQISTDSSLEAGL